MFKDLYNVPGFFEKTTPESGGIVWNDEIDIAEEYVYDNSQVLI